ncbi:hypothetical protein ACFSQ3_08510 [Sphingobacterium corticis]|uniref:Uncharacterized protein n=1 Tax=Sphingobacterium corticis TaxID=1812823 RepID=A0ABW5NK38_9SPHI
MKDLQKWWILISFMFLMNHAFAQTNSSTELFAKNPKKIFLGALVKKSSINGATHETLNTSADSVVILPSELMLDYRRFSGGKNAFN